MGNMIKGDKAMGETSNTYSPVRTRRRSGRQVDVEKVKPAILTGTVNKARHMI